MSFRREEVIKMNFFLIRFSLLWSKFYFSQNSFDLSIKQDHVTMFQHFNRLLNFRFQLEFMNFINFLHLNFSFKFFTLFKEAFLNFNFFLLYFFENSIFTILC
jgi:hypothetical protein